MASLGYYRWTLLGLSSAQVVAAIGGREDFRRFVVWRQSGRGAGAGSGARRLAPADCPYRYVLSVARRARWTRYERAARDPTARPSRNRKQITTYPVSNAPYACVKPHFVPTSTYVI